MLYKIVRPLIKIFFMLIYRPCIVGKEFIPKNSSAILAGNHTNNLDCLLLMSSTDRVIHFLGKHTLFTGIKGPIMTAMNVIPVDRTKPKNREALKRAKEVLSQKKVIGIFPEGTINRTDELTLPFKMGTVYLSKNASSPIVPFIITGKYRTFKNDLKITFLPPYTVTSSNLDEENHKLMNLIRENLERTLR